ncbi:MAG: hypothetical protein Q4C39_04360 [Clostridia bacterium]|nr:hypothetical protein [Clostridia bacterium]
MSTNVQVRAIIGEFGKKMRTIASGEMQISGKKDLSGEENFIHILVHEGVLENGIIKEEKVEENRR